MNRRLQKIITDDGSESYLDANLGEHYHSTGGALAEARQKHVGPAEIMDRYNKNGGKIDILDFGFGLGYNSAAALDLLLGEKCISPSIHITALENDRDILQQILSVNPDLKGYDIFKEFAQNSLNYTGFISPFIYTFENLAIKLYLENALKRISFLKDRQFDVVFFDPFSSGRIPELWSFEVFKTLFNKMKSGACLTTYSCAKHFRNKLEKSGFIWTDVAPGFERRGPSTIAFKP